MTHRNVISVYRNAKNVYRFTEKFGGKYQYSRSKSIFYFQINTLIFKKLYKKYHFYFMILDFAIDLAFL